MGTLAYLASPYSDADPAVQQERHAAVCRKAGELISQGRNVLSPIAHNLAIISETKALSGWDRWRQQDEAMLRACDELLVLRLPGWESSEGVQAEMEIAIQLGLPIDFVDA